MNIIFALFIYSLHVQHEEDIGELKHEFKEELVQAIKKLKEEIKVSITNRVMNLIGIWDTYS